MDYEVKSEISSTLRKNQLLFKKSKRSG